MKAAVFSDTHSCTALAVEAVRRSRPDLIIHLGDYAADAQTIHAEFPEIPIYSVRGNCDIASDAPDTDVVPIGPIKAFITHGHLYNVRYGDCTRLVYAAMEEGAKIVAFGHTHEPLYEEFGGITVLNPGTAGAGRILTWACVEVANNGAITVDIKNL